jgi:glycosyltransferase involved in cell wall biosynthesis
MNDDGSYRLNPRNETAPSSRPLVSCITGTWQRHAEIKEAIASIRAQTYRPLEHVIVSDGPDDQLRRMVDALSTDDVDVPIIYAECGRNWSSFLSASLSAVPFQVAQWLARGEYLAWWADDEIAVPDHIEALVDLLEATDSDFVYPRVDLWFKDGQRKGFVIGSDPPVHGAITHALYRADLLDYRGFTTHIGSGTDWDQIREWMAAGARWAMLDRVTFRHRIDKNGEGLDYRAEQRPLKGHSRRGR